MANKQKNSTWDNMIKPVVVLFTICLVVSGLLAVTNNITAPIIAENETKNIANLPKASLGRLYLNIVRLSFVKVKYTSAIAPTKTAVMNAIIPTNTAFLSFNS